MLQNIRENLQGTLAKVVVFIICVPFVLFGVESFFRGGGEAAIAEVGAIEITQKQLDRESRRQQQRLLNEMGENFDPALVSEEAIREMALETLIQKAVVTHTAQNLGLVASPRKVSELISEQQAFQQEGKFSAELFSQTVMGAGFLPSEYQALVADAVAAEQLNSAYTVTNITSQAQVRVLTELLNQKRDVSYLVLSQAAAAASVEVSDTDVEDYFDQHSAEYMTQEKVAVNYFSLSASDFYESIEEEELRAAYEAELNEIKVNAQRRVGHILLDTSSRTDEEAEQLLLSARERISSGENFSDLAKEISEDPGSANEGGDLGFVQAGVYPEKFEAAYAQLNAGDISAPVQTEAGWHLITVLEDGVSEAPSFEARRDSILSSLQRSTAEPHYLEAVERLNDLIYDDFALEDLAIDQGKVVANSGYFSRSGAASGLFSDSTMVGKIFELQSENSAAPTLIEKNDGEVMIVALDGYQAASPQAFEEVSQVIRGRVIQEKAEVKLRQSSSNLIALSANKSLGDIATQEGLELQEFLGVSRIDQGGVAPEVLEFAFTLDPSQANVSSHVMRDGSIALVAVSNVVVGVADETDAMTSPFTRLLQESSMQRLLTSQFDYFKRTAYTTVN